MSPRHNGALKDVYHLNIHLSSQHPSLSTDQRKDCGPYIPYSMYIYMHTHTYKYIFILHIYIYM